VSPMREEKEEEEEEEEEERIKDLRSEPARGIIAQSSVRFHMLRDGLHDNLPALHAGASGCASG